MINRHNYYLISEQTRKMGFWIETSGFSKVDKESAYPLLGHPDAYHFSWDKGRVLQEHQVLMISQGEGMLETSSAGRLTLKPGDVFFLFPGEWHRYKPNKKTGWEENWIGFKGPQSRVILESLPVKSTYPMLHINNVSKIFSCFTAASAVVTSSIASQMLLSGILLQLLGYISQDASGEEKIEAKNKTIIEQVHEIMLQHITLPLSPTDIARMLNMSYSTFRRKFREYTGLSPAKYYLQLRIKKAMSIIQNSDKPIKVVAEETGFDNIFHFSNTFREQTGLTPSGYRKGID